jgi:hypothetical protein
VLRRAGAGCFMPPAGLPVAVVFIPRRAALHWCALMGAWCQSGCLGPLNTVGIGVAACHVGCGVDRANRAHGCMPNVIPICLIFWPLLGAYLLGALTYTGCCIRRQRRRRLQAPARALRTLCGRPAPAEVCLVRNVCAVLALCTAVHTACNAAPPAWSW